MGVNPEQVRGKPNELPVMGYMISKNYMLDKVEFLIVFIGANILSMRIHFFWAPYKYFSSQVYSLLLLNFKVSISFQFDFTLVFYVY